MAAELYEPMDWGQPHDWTGTPEAESILHESVGGALGTNAGGFYTGKDGVSRYVKFYKNPQQARAEHLANRLYRDLGLGAPASQVFSHEGGLAYASQWLPGQTLEQTGMTKELAHKVLEGFAADVLMANWDPVGFDNDNIIVLPDGSVARIDNGAAFLLRARGTPKKEHLLDDIREWEQFFSGDTRDFSSSLYAYQDLTQAAGTKSPSDFADIVKSSVEKIVALRDSSGGWANYLKTAVPEMPEKEAARIAQLLDARTEKLRDKVGAWN